MTKPTLSVVLITLNESKHINDCLASVAWADEIIVVDSGSTDDTVEIAHTFNAKVIHQDWLGFGPQKQFAIEQASGDWILSLDADERIDNILKDEILHSIAAHPHETGYFIPRLSYFCGQAIHHSGWRPDHVLRLFKRGQGRFSADPVHEKIELDGQSNYLTHSIIHYSYDTFEQVLQKINRYSTLSAQKMFEQGKRSSLTKIITKSSWAFFRAYCIRLGFLDGKKGFMLAISIAEHCFYKYVKLYLLQETSTKRGS